MASINISITREIYNKLKQLKRSNESFSSVINRLISEKANPFEYEGMWEDWDDVVEFEEGIKKARKNDLQKGSSIIKKWGSEG